MQVRNVPALKQTRQRLRRESTYPEKILWHALRRRNACGIRFKRQYSVLRHVLDLYAPSVKLAIEIDGASHNSAAERERDARRQREIEAVGISFLRFTNDEVVMKSDWVVEVIENKVRELLDRG